MLACCFQVRTYDAKNYTSIIGLGIPVLDQIRSTIFPLNESQMSDFDVD